MGNLKFGTNTPLALYMGASGSTKAYYGTTVVYEGGGKDYSKEYLTLEILSDGTIVFATSKTSIRKKLYYSINDGEWEEIVTSKTTPPTVDVSNGDKVRIKSTNTELSNQSLSGSTAYFNLSGNIMSVIYGDDFINKDFTSSPNISLFSWGNVVSAEHLVLPSNLNVNNCFVSMFYGCTSLTTAPELPATALTANCYENMFRGCTSLTTAPELPALTLQSICYRDMFNGCTSLTTAPELPATTLAPNCYQRIFKNCSNLNYVKCLATDITATDCTFYWLAGVAASGTFEKAPAMTSWSRDDNGIPSGWTVIDVS